MRAGGDDRGERGVIGVGGATCIGLTREMLATINGSTLVEAACLYARAGWPIFPLHNPVNGGCSCRRSACRDRAKHPRTRHGFKDATTSEPQVASWWRRWPEANIGVVTGAASGLLVVDLDPAKGGFASWTEACARSSSDEPITLRARTGSGGLHLYFRYPTGIAVRNKQGIWPGVDIRGEGGYVVASPSLHISGGQYPWML